MAQHRDFLLLIILVILAGGIYYRSTIKIEAPPTPQISDAVYEGINTGIVGTWRLQDDETFTREIKEDGEVIDRYQKAATTTVQTGVWRLFTQVRLPPDLSTINALPIRSDTLYLQFVFGETAFNFSVLNMADGLLTLGYLDRAGTTVFKKVE